LVRGPTHVGVVLGLVFLGATHLYYAVCVCLKRDEIMRKIVRNQSKRVLILRSPAVLFVFS
jgi:hypothetical protein